MDAFKGTFTRTSADQYDDLLKVLNFSWLLRKAATASTPTVTISEDAGTWSIKTATTVKTMETKFRLDEKFDDVSVDGREVSCLAKFDQGKLIITQDAKKEGEKSLKTVREMVEGQLKYTITVSGSDVVCVQTFKRA